MWGAIIFCSLQLPFFTVSKTLFLQFVFAYELFHKFLIAGNFNVLPALHKLIESTRCSSLEDLHMTSIRNEHAYYQCIVEVLADRAMIINMKHTNSEGKTLADKAQGVEIMEDMINNKSCLGLVCNDTWSMKLSIDKALIEEASARPIYIVGDSHCLSPAWSILHIEGSFHGENRPDDTRLNPVFDSSTDITSEKKKGTPRLLLPRLVTGVKQWHLRPKGNFYTKTNFHQTVRAIPSNAEVSL